MVRTADPTKIHSHSWQDRPATLATSSFYELLSDWRLEREAVP